MDREAWSPSDSTTSFQWGRRRIFPSTSPAAFTEASIAKAKEQSERMLESAKTQLGGFHEEAADRFRVHETGSDADFSIAGWGA